MPRINAHLILKNRSVIVRKRIVAKIIVAIPPVLLCSPISPRAPGISRTILWIKLINNIAITACR